MSVRCVVWSAVIISLERVVTLSCSYLSHTIFFINIIASQPKLHNLKIGYLILYLACHFIEVVESYPPRECLQGNTKNPILFVYLTKWAMKSKQDDKKANKMSCLEEGYNLVMFTKGFGLLWEKWKIKELKMILCSLSNNSTETTSKGRFHLFN